ncbi:hypothetical protein, partial [Geminicoccus harenae]
VNRAKAGRFEVPLTRGQATGRADYLADEEAMRSGARGGNAAYDTLSRFDQRQAEALKDASRKLGTEFGGGRPMPQTTQDVGELVAQGVRGRASDADDAVRAAYRNVDMKGTRFDAGSAGQFMRDTVRRIRADEVVDSQLTPHTASVLGEMNRMAKAAEKAVDLRANPTISLKQAETFRRRLALRIEKTKADPQLRSDNRLLNSIRADLDAWLDDAIDTALLKGDDNAMDFLKEARALRRSYGDKFEIRPKDADAGKVMQRILSTDTTNQEVANWLYGAGELGSSTSSKRVLERMGKALGEDSQEWAAIKQGAWVRMIWGNKAQSLGEMPKDTIINRINNALNGRGKEITERLFTPAERAAIAEFRDVLKLTTTPRRLTNPSGSGAYVERAMRQMTSRMASATLG